MDLNPVRAGLAANPEQCDFTSAQERIADLQAASEVRQLKPGKRGSVSKTAPPILERLNLSPELWLAGRGTIRKTRLREPSYPCLPVQCCGADPDSEINVAKSLKTT